VHDREAAAKDSPSKEASEGARKMGQRLDVVSFLERLQPNGCVNELLRLW